MPRPPDAAPHKRQARSHDARRDAAYYAPVNAAKELEERITKLEGKGV
jgi:hypothetical protein